MNRSDSKALARIRLREAELLLANRLYAGSYYLCGYVIECELKACIAKKTRRFDFPDKKVVESSHTHDFSKLINNAGLKSALDNEKSADRLFDINWTIVQGWTEVSRYEKHSRQEAEDLYNAISDPAHGMC